MVNMQYRISYTAGRPSWGVSEDYRLRSIEWVSAFTPDLVKIEQSKQKANKKQTKSKQKAYKSKANQLKEKEHKDIYR
jgi:hypothetical protein